MLNSSCACICTSYFYLCNIDLPHSVFLPIHISWLVRCKISSRSKTTQSSTCHVPEVSAAPRVDILLLAWLRPVRKTVWLLDKTAQLHTVCLCHTTCQVFDTLKVEWPAYQSACLFNTFLMLIFFADTDLLLMNCIKYRDIILHVVLYFSC